MVILSPQQKKIYKLEGKIMGWFSSDIDNFKFNENWCEDAILHTIGEVALEDGRTGKVYKQIRTIIKHGDVPDSAGIYLFRDSSDRKNLYCGRTDNIRGRLPDHLSGREGKVRKGEQCLIRWAKSYNPYLSEALAIIFFNPERNHKTEKQPLRKYSSTKVFEEAERLGFYNSRDNNREFITRILQFIYEL